MLNLQQRKKIAIMQQLKQMDETPISTPTPNPTPTVKVPIVPEHLILEHILLRLPVKSLIRFKCVSKLWHSTISSSEFAISHFKFRRSFPRQFVIITHNPFDSFFKLTLLPYDELNYLKPPVELDFTIDCCDDEPNPVYYANIVASCHGLLCLYKRYSVDSYFTNRKLGGNFIICNLATFQYSDIPNPVPQHSCHSDYWFGCIPSGDGHKIVAKFQSHDIGASYVYSVRSGKWNSIYDPSNFLVGNRFRNKTRVFNDILYFSTVSLSEPRRKHIVRLDLANDQLKEFPWVDWFSQYSGGATFFVMNGYLSLLCSADDLISDVWMMKQHDNWSSWEKLYYVDLGSCSLFSITPTGMFLVRHRSSEVVLGQLKLIDPVEILKINSKEMRMCVMQ